MNANCARTSKLYILSALLLIGFVLPAHATITTYYEVWRNTTNNPNTAQRIQQWHTQASYEDTNITPGVNYYYWIRALACKEQSKEHQWAAKWFILTIECPIKATADKPSPVRGRVQISDGTFSVSNSYPCFIKDDRLIFNKTIYEWNVWAYAPHPGSPIIADSPFDYDLDLYRNSGDESKIFLQIETYGGFYLETTPISVTKLSNPDTGPLSSASQGTYSDKIVVTWNPTTNICSEITHNTPSSVGWAATPSPLRQLTIDKSGGGRVYVDGTERSPLPWTGTYDQGQLINLNAVPDSGWAFSHWSGSISSSSNPINVQLNNNANIIANFIDMGSAPLVDINLTASADSTVTSPQPNLNTGQIQNIWVGRSYWDGTIVDNNRCYIKFDLSSIASGSLIESAWMFLSPSGGMGSFTMLGHACSQAWTENGITWNNQPSVHSSPYIQSNVSGSNPPTMYMYEVTPFINQWINHGRANHGFRLNYADGTASHNTIIFYSREYSDSTKRPKLGLRVYETITSPTSVSGPTQGGQGDSLSFTVSGAASNLSHSLQYRFDWGDGTQSSWSSNTARSKTYTSTGQYQIRVQARCAEHRDAMSSWSPVLRTVTIVPSTRAISGYVRDSSNNGISGVSVTANNGGGSTTTNSSGYYSLTVPYGWSGTVMPNNISYDFSPAYRAYTNITSNQTDQNYTTVLKTVTISGYVRDFADNGIDGVLVSANNGGGSTTTNSSGYYSLTVSHGWSGTVMPVIFGYYLYPEYNDYSNVISDQANQNYNGHFTPDVDGDGSVDMKDFGILAGQWLSEDCQWPEYCGRADINHSGVVDIGDLFILAENWLAGAESPQNYLLNETFESYDVESWPSPWVKGANANASATNKIVQDPINAFNRVLKMHGSIGSCWGALAYRPCVFTDDFYVEAKIYNGSEILSGCHLARGTLGMRKGTSWVNPWFEFLKYHNNGTLTAADGSVLMNYSTATWYTIKIHYRRIGSEVFLTYWVDGQNLGQKNITITDMTNHLLLDHFELTAQEGSVYFDDLRVYASNTIPNKILIVNPDNYRILKHGLKTNIGPVDTCETHCYLSIAHGEVADQAGGLTNPDSWSGVGGQSDYLGTLLEQAGAVVDYCESHEMTAITASDYGIVIIQDPLRTNIRQFSATEVESGNPDLLEFVCDAGFISRINQYIQSGGNVVFVGDAVKLLGNGEGRLNYGKTITEKRPSHTVNQPSCRIPSDWFFVRGNPFCGVDRNGSGQYIVESGSLASSGTMVSSVINQNLNDLARAYIWSETLYAPTDGTSLLNLRFDGEGQYVLDGSICNPPVYTVTMNDLLTNYMGYTHYSGRRIYYISSDSFFDFDFFDHEGAWHAAQYSRLKNVISLNGKNIVFSLLNHIFEHAGSDYRIPTVTPPTPVFDRFESGTFSTLPWQQAGNAPWVIVSDTKHEGSYAAKSGLITHNQQSSLELTIDGNYSTVSFFRKVSSESNFDFLRFYVDGVQQASWSGNQDWAVQTFNIESGQRVLKWSYTKDGSVDSGSDCAWIDSIRIE